MTPVVTLIVHLYPVIYWLHGGFGSARQRDWAVANLDRGMRAGLAPEAIVVLVQALPVAWYVNSKDGKRPIEDWQKAFGAAGQKAP